MTTIYFATDIHGSDLCWQKFINAGKFYGADVLILGGDMTGKAIVPIVHQGGEIYKTTLLEHNYTLTGEVEVAAMVKRIKSRGYYPYRTNPDEVAELNANPQRVHTLFVNEALATLERWIAYADERLKGSGLFCCVCPGNDDMVEVDEIIRQSQMIQLVEGQVITIPTDGADQHEMISSGWSNPTPWHTYREEPEEGLWQRFDRMIANLKNPRTSIFNMHVPPYGSLLDEAPELDGKLRPRYAGNATHPVGSRAVRALIEKHQPLLGLHGHIHESRATIRLGHTLCINPGSMYEQGSLLGALIQLGKDKVKNYVLTTG